MLVIEVARLLRRNFNRRAQDRGLTQTQWQALAHLSRDQGMNQACLADLLEVQPITATPGWSTGWRPPAGSSASPIPPTGASSGFS